MVSALRKLLNSIFDHEHESGDSAASKRFSNSSYESPNNVVFSSENTHLSIQKKKQLIAKNHVSDTHIKQYLKNLIEYDTEEYFDITKHLTLSRLDDSKRDPVNSARENKDEDMMLNFHCIYCHLLRVLLYHPIKYKSSSGKVMNAINEYCKDYDYLSNKLGRALSFVLSENEGTVGKTSLIKNVYGLSSGNSEQQTNFLQGGHLFRQNVSRKKINLGKLNYIINNLEVNTSDLYAYQHEFDNSTGRDLTFKNLTEENEKELNSALKAKNAITNNDRVNTMLTWVIEDCYVLFMPLEVSVSLQPVPRDEQSATSFEFDCAAALQRLKKEGVNSDKVSRGKKVWLERRRKQYEFYSTKEKETTEAVSCLESNRIRPVSYLKIYELLMSGISIKQHLNLEDFMVICFVGWMHDGKWEEGIRA